LRMHPRSGTSQNPKTFVFVASEDNSNWVVLIQNGTAPADWSANFGGWGQWEMDSLRKYKYFAVIVTATINDVLCAIKEIEILGVPEYDPEAHGTDVIARSVPNVPNTDWLEVYYDGQDYTSMPSTVTDKSGNGVTGTPTNVTFDSTWKAFVFDEADDYITFSPGKSGNYVFSASIWFKSTGSSIETLFTLNGDNTSNQGAWLYGNGNNLIFDFSNNAYTCDIGRFIGDGQWHHVCCTYNGDGSISGRDIYLDGMRLYGVLTGTSAGGTLNLTSSTSAQIGAYNHPSLGYIHEFKGSIANFRLFNRALTGDEIWQLYAYQKDYFQVSPDVVTFKGGRLGVGTSEPRAVLDVRGSFYAPGSVVQVVTNPHWGQATYTSSGGAEVKLAVLQTSITPKFSNSKLVVQVYMSYEADYNSVIFVRANDRDIPYGRGYGDKEGTIPTAYDGEVGSTPNSSAFVVHHEVDSNEPVTYDVIYKMNGTSTGTIHINEGYTTTDEHGTCYVVVWEIAQ